MTKSQLLAAIKVVAGEESRTEIEVITEMQSACVVTGDEDTLEILCDLKWEYIA